MILLALLLLALQGRVLRDTNQSWASALLSGDGSYLPQLGPRYGQTELKATILSSSSRGGSITQILQCWVPSTLPILQMQGILCILPFTYRLLQGVRALRVTPIACHLASQEMSRDVKGVSISNLEACFDVAYEVSSREHQCALQISTCLQPSTVSGGTSASFRGIWNVLVLCGLLMKTFFSVPTLQERATADDANLAE